MLYKTLLIATFFTTGVMAMQPEDADRSEDEDRLESLPTDMQERINSYLGIRGKSHPGKSEILKQKVGQEKFSKPMIFQSIPDFKTYLQSAKEFGFSGKFASLTLKSSFDCINDAFIDNFKSMFKMMTELKLFIYSGLNNVSAKSLIENIFSINPDIKLQIDSFYNIGWGPIHDPHAPNLSLSFQQEMKEKYGDHISFDPIVFEG